MSKEPMLGKLADAVLDGNEELTKQLVKDALEQGQKSLTECPRELEKQVKDSPLESTFYRS